MFGNYIFLNVAVIPSNEFIRNGFKVLTAITLSYRADGWGGGSWFNIVTA